MTTRGDRERQQKTNERNKNVLAIILAREENKFCADCCAKGPRWASWNLGLLICIRCSGLHRSLGVHISKVKSVNLDTWTTPQMVQFCSRGNGWAKEYFEARLPSDFKRPQNDQNLEYFIRDKYEKKKYISQKEIPLRSISDLGLNESNGVQQKKPSSKPRIRESTGNQVKLRETTNPSIPRPKSSSKLSQQASAMKPITPQTNNNTQDLLGLNSPTPVPASVPPNNKPSSDLTEDLFGPMSSYNDGLGQVLSFTTTQAAPSTNSSSNADLLNGITTETNVQTDTQTPELTKKMSKDSILSLYSNSTPAVSNPLQMNNGNAGFGVPSSQMHVTQQQYHQQQRPPNNYYQGQSAMPHMNQQHYGMQNGMNPQQQQQMMAMQQQQQQMLQMQQQMHSMQLQQQQQPNNMMMNGYAMPTMQAANPAMYGMPQQNMQQMGYQMPMQNQQQPPANQMWGANNGGQTLSTQLWK